MPTVRQRVPADVSAAPSSNKRHLRQRLSRVLSLATRRNADVQTNHGIVVGRLGEGSWKQFKSTAAGGRSLLNATLSNQPPPPNTLDICPARSCGCRSAYLCFWFAPTSWLESACCPTGGCLLRMKRHRARFLCAWRITCRKRKYSRNLRKHCREHVRSSRCSAARSRKCWSSSSMDSWKSSSASGVMSPCILTQTSSGDHAGAKKPLKAKRPRANSNTSSRRFSISRNHPFLGIFWG